MSFQEQVNNFFGGIKQGISGSSRVAKIATVSAIAVLILLGAWWFYWFPKRQNEAAKEKARLHYFYENDSSSVVLNGLKAKKIMSAPQIADKYWLTSAGKECAYMAATSYLKKGKFEQALKYFKKTGAKDQLMGAMALKGTADCYAEMKEYSKAGDYYMKAAEKGDNDLFVKYYLWAGMHYELAKDMKSALRAYEKAKENFTESAAQMDEELNKVDTYIAKAKAALGEL